jgi:hypothetical protein
MSLSKTMWALHLDDSHDTRFGAALEMLRDGRRIGYHEISIGLGADVLDCCAAANWNASSLTEEHALAQLTEMVQIIDDLERSRPDFALIVGSRRKEFSLVRDYGSGIVELCRLEGGRAMGPGIATRTSPVAPDS